MVRDVPEKSADSSEMHEIEQIHELMEAERQVEEILNHTPEEEEDSSSESGQTVATNTTR